MDCSFLEPFASHLPDSFSIGFDYFKLFCGNKPGELWSMHSNQQGVRCVNFFCCQELMIHVKVSVKSTLTGTWPAQIDTREIKLCCPFQSWFSVLSGSISKSSKFYIAAIIDGAVNRHCILRGDKFLHHLIKSIQIMESICVGAM